MFSVRERCLCVLIVRNVVLSIHNVHCLKLSVFWYEIIRAIL